jgi:NADH-quinone oxidoreductase subunit C
MSEALQALAETLTAALPGVVTGHAIAYGELTVTAKASDIVNVIRYLREQRFDVVYHLLSPYTNQRIRVKIEVGEDDTVDSIIGIFPGADWFERETYDLYGIPFVGHPDMRRILTDYGFEGHPLRKDFPLTGFVEVRYDDQQKRVVYDKVRLAQEFRNFDFLSPWEGPDYKLPGDEKAEQKP